jgi:hypothetical protein
LITSSVQMRRQRQLHQDAVHRRIGVQLVDQRQKLGLRSLGGRRCSKLAIPTSTVEACLLRT